MKKLLYLGLLVLTMGQMPPAIVPIGSDTNSLRFAFEPSFLASGYWLFTNNVRAFPVESTFYVSDFPPGETLYKVTATNDFGESDFSNTVTNYVPPILTNWIMNINCKVSITNAPGNVFFALCSSTNLHNWLPVMTASNTYTRTNF